jgi:hypothetical protein
MKSFILECKIASWHGYTSLQGVIHIENDQSMLMTTEYPSMMNKGAVILTCFEPSPSLKSDMTPEHIHSLFSKATHIVGYDNNPYPSSVSGLNRSYTITVIQADGNMHYFQFYEKAVETYWDIDTSYFIKSTPTDTFIDLQCENKRLTKLLEKSNLFEKDRLIKENRKLREQLLNMKKDMNDLAKKI